MKNQTVRANLSALLLSVIAKKPRHGYDARLEIRRKTGVFLPPSILYPALKDAEQHGLLTGKWIVEGKPKKIYTITKKGLETLTDTQIELKVILGEMIIVK